MITRPESPAYPVPNDAHENGQPGLTKREEFARAALPVALVYFHTKKVECDEKDIATKAVQLADALIAALNKQTTDNVFRVEDSTGTPPPQ